MFPTAATRFPLTERIDSTISTVVVLPLVPETTSHGAGCSSGRNCQASCSPLQMRLVRSSLLPTGGWVELPGKAQGVDHARQFSRATEADIGTESLKNFGAFALFGTCRTIALVDDCHEGTYTHERVGRSKPSSPETSDGGADTGPVVISSRAQQPLRSGLGCARRA